MRLSLVKTAFCILFFSPATAGKGVGSTLMAEAMDVAAKNNFRMITCMALSYYTQRICIKQNYCEENRYIEPSVSFRESGFCTLKYYINDNDQSGAITGRRDGRIVWAEFSQGRAHARQKARSLPAHQPRFKNLLCANHYYVVL